MAYLVIYKGEMKSGTEFSGYTDRVNAYPPKLSDINKIMKELKEYVKEDVEWVQVTNVIPLMNEDK